MKKLLTLSLVIFAFSASAQHKAHRLEYDDDGHVFFERRENVHKRDAQEIMRFARGFARQQKATIISDDTANNTLKLLYRWKMTDVSKSHKLYNVTFVTTVEISSKYSRTRIYAADIRYEGVEVCGKTGDINQLLKCDEVPKGQKNAIAVFFNEGPFYDLGEEYKKYLLKAVRSDEW